MASIPTADALSHVKAQLALDDALPMETAIRQANELMGLPNEGSAPDQVQALLEAVGGPPEPLGADAERSSEEDEPSSTQNPIQPSLGAEELVRKTMPFLAAAEKEKVLEGVDWGEMSWDERRDRILEVGYGRS